MLAAGRLPDTRLAELPQRLAASFEGEYLTVRWQGNITVNSAVMHGKECIRGTRLPVAVVLANLAERLSDEQIIRSNPSLTLEAIQAASACATELAQERVLTLPA